MRDIVPYTDVEAGALGRTLVCIGCPSFGPAVGLELLRVVEGIDKILKREDIDGATKGVLIGLRARFG